VFAKPRFLVVVVALAVSAGGAALAAAYGYSWLLVLACGVYGAAWVVQLNSPRKMPFRRAALLLVPTFVGLSVVPFRAMDEGDSPYVPFLVILLAVAVHLLVLAAVRREQARRCPVP